MRALLLLLVFACKDRKEAPPKPTAGDAATSVDAKPDLAAELETIRAQNDVPALGLVAWRGGVLLENAAVGTRKQGDTTKVTTKDKWHLGSNTKAMTATLIGIYVDRGAIKWTDTIGKLFKGRKIDKGYVDVTLDQLVRHEGGAPGQPPDELWSQLWKDGDKPEARKKFVDGTLARPPNKVGTFEYSNAGYMIAGHALEIATGKRWEDLMRTELFDKLGMTSCGFGAPTGEAPWGHDESGKPIEPGPQADNPPGLGPAGTVHCTLEDYGKFLAMHSRGEPALVTPETMQHLHTARGDGNYAGGWLVMGKTLAHSGNNTMWHVSAMVVLAPEDKNKLVVVLASNSGKQSVENAMFGLMSLFIP